MKLITGIVASLVIGSLSFGAFAAKEIQKMKWVNEADEIGSITTSKQRHRWMQSAICRRRRMSWAASTLW